MTLDDLAARMAALRENPVELLPAAERAHGVVFGEELREWVRLFERFELETIEPNFTELRAPDATCRLRTVVEVDDPSRLAGVVALFTGSSIVGQQDELSYLAAWAPTASGLSKVYHFHPEDWGMWLTDPALVVRLYRLLQEDKAELASKRLLGEDLSKVVGELAALTERERASALEVHLDPERLFGRVAWLVHLFLGHGSDWKSELQKAGTIRDWQREREHAATWPHLAMYWLWSHVMLGNLSELDELFAITRSSTSPLVHESRDLVRALREGRDVRLGMRTGQVLDAFREQLQDEAPPAALGSGARERKTSRDRSTTASADEEQRHKAALAELQDPKVKEALQLLEHLDQGGVLREPVLKAKIGLGIDEAVERFVSLVDQRFRPLLLAKLRKAARWPDSSPHATHGLLLAFQHVAKSWQEFDQVVRAAGFGNFGARRLTELHRAIGRFQDPGATERLVEAARAYVAELESWEPKTPPEALLLLFTRDVSEAHELAAEVLERASFSGANTPVALRAAEAAGRLRSKRAVPGLIRAVERELGRIDDGTRVRVVSSLVAAGGAEGLPVLRRLFEERVARWQAEDDRAGSYLFYHKDLAGWLAGLLPLAPKDEALIAKSREMLAAFLRELAADKKPRRDLIYATAALLRGIGNGRVHPLAEDVDPFLHLLFHEDRATSGLRDMLIQLARSVRERL